MKYMICILLFATSLVQAQVKHTGSMGEMGKNNFAAHIYLDSLSTKKGTFGLGPLGKMQGEIMVLDGIPMNAQVQADGTIKVSQSWKVTAPFFVYAEVQDWVSKAITARVKNPQDLQSLIEAYAVEMGYDLNEPFPFRLQGIIDQQIIHVVMPRSAELPGYVAGKNSENYELIDEPGELLGFYSQQGESIYTHKDSYIHVHFVNEDRTVMGHVDNIEFTEEMLLYLPVK